MPKSSGKFQPRTRCLRVLLLLVFGLFAWAGQAQIATEGLVFPKTGFVTDETAVPFQWNAVSGAVSYQLQLATDASFSSVLLTTGAASTTNPVSGLPANTQYYWRVRVFDGSQFGPWSNAREFRTVRLGDLGSNLLWLRADSMVTETANSVSLWSDLGPTGNHFRQNTASRQPELVDSILAGEPVIRFDGNDFLKGIDTMNFSQGYSLFLVTRNRIRKNFNGIFRLASVFNGNNTWLEVTWENGSTNNASGNLSVVANRAGTQKNAGLANSPPAVGAYQVQQFVVNASGFKAYSNDSNFISSNGTGFLPAQGDSAHLGCGFNNNFIDGDMAEVAIFGTDLSDSLRSLAFEYLSQRHAPLPNLGPNVNETYALCTTLQPAGEFESYLWSTGSTDSAITVFSSGMYAVTTTDRFGRQGVDTVKITLPTITSLNDTSICTGTNLLWNPGLPNAGYTFAWSDGSSDSTLAITTAGTYAVTITDTVGCTFESDSVDVQVDLVALSISLGADTTLCSGDLIAVQSTNKSISTYTWSTGSTDSTLAVTTTGTYSVAVSDQSGCTDSDTIQVTVAGSVPIVNFSVANLCLGDTTAFTDLSVSGDASALVDYDWDFGNGDTSDAVNPELTYADSGNYTVNLTVTAASGCASSASQSILVNQLPVAGFTVSGVPIAGTATDFTDTSFAFHQNTITNWDWDFGDGTGSTQQNPSKNFSATGSLTVSLKVTDDQGCMAEDSATVQVLPEPFTAGLLSWLKPEAGVTQSGGSVSAWADQSGNGQDFTQASSSNQPVFQSQGINGLPLLTFDGSNDYLQSSSGLDLTNNFSLFIIAKNDLRKNFNGLFRVGNGIGGGTTSFLEVSWEQGTSNSGSGNLGHVFNRSASQKNAPLVTNAPPAINNYYIYDVAATDSSLRVSINDSFYLNLIDTDYLPSQVESGFLGVGFQTSGYLNGDVVEVMVYDSALNLTERAQVIDYLRQKYAPPVDLGADRTILYGFCAETLDANSRYLTYNWSTGDTTQTIDVARTGSYSVTVTDVFGFQSVDTIQITYPDVAQQADTLVCDGDTVTWVPGLNTGYSFLWSDGSTDTLLQVLVTGDYLVTISDTIGCQFTTDTATITVDTTPLEISLGNDTSICEAEFIGPPTTNSPLVAYQWSTGSSDSAISVLTSGDYWVMAQELSGCSDIDTINVTVLGQPPIPNFSASNFCQGDSTQFQDLSVPQGASTLSQWEWDLGTGGDSAFVQNPAFVYPDSGDFNVTLVVTADNGCAEMVTNPITIYKNPVVNFGFTGTPIVNLQATFSDSSEFFQGNSLLSVNWDFGDLSTGNGSSVNHTYSTAGSVTVKSVVTDDQGCMDSLEVPITVLPAPELLDIEFWLKPDFGLQTSGTAITGWDDQSGNNSDFDQVDVSAQPQLLDSLLLNYPGLTFDGSNDFLKGAEVDFTNGFSYFLIGRNHVRKNFNGLLRVGDGVAPSSESYFEIHWTQGTSNSGSMNHVGNRSGTQVNAGVISNPPIDTNDFYIYAGVFDANGIKVRLNDSLYLDQSITGLPPQQADTAFVGAGFMPGGFINGEIVEVIAYDSALTDAQVDQVTNYLRFKYAPPVDLGPDLVIPYGYCDTSIAAQDHFTSYLWSTGQTTPSITISESGTYSVSVTDVFGFVTADTITVTYPQVPQIGLDTVLCAGDSIVWDAAPGPGYTYLWQDNSTNSSLTIHTGGQYWVAVTDSFGCADTSQVSMVTLDNFPLVASLGPDESVCSGHRLELQVGTEAASSFIWSTGGFGSFIEVNSTGQYWLNVTDTSGCVAIDTINLTVVSLPPAIDFSNVNRCFGDATTFTDLTVPLPNDPVNNWEWDFGDGQSSIVQSPAHVYADTGLYDVQLTVTSDSGCVAIQDAQVFISALPIVDFTSSFACSDLLWEGDNLSTSAHGEIAMFDWAIVSEATGQIDSLDTEFPVFAFDTSGTFEITLLLTSDSGCVAVDSQFLAVAQSPQVVFTANRACIGTPTFFTDNYSGTNFTWDWSFGDFSSSALDDPQHTYSDTGSYRASLLLTDRVTECYDTLIQFIEVLPDPVAGIGDSVLCSGEVVTFTDESVPVPTDSIVDWQWEIFNGATLTGQAPKFVFTDTGIVSLTLTVTSSEGCSDAVNRILHVLPVPEPAFDFSPKFGVPPLDITFENQTINATNYMWTFSGGDTLTDFEPSYTFLEEGEFQVKLIATNAIGCADSVQRQVRLREPVIDLIVEDLQTNEVGNFVEITTTITNGGTVEVTDFELLATVTGLPGIKEQWVGNLGIGESIQYTFNAQIELVNGELPEVICVEAQNPMGFEDDQPDDNEQCISNEGLILSAIYPNPTFGEVTVEFVLPRQGDTYLAVYDKTGREMRVLINRELDAGFHRVQFGTNGWSAGSYTLRLDFETQSEAARFIRN